MTEMIEMKEPAEIAAPVEEIVKPYTFRKLAAEDMFLMFRILGKIGIKEFKNAFAGDELKQLIAATKKGGEKALTAVGVSVFIDAVDIILGNIYKCENEIYKLLAQVSGMAESEIKADALLFTEMVVDFFKKEEFPAFIKVVSRSFR